LKKQCQNVKRGSRYEMWRPQEPKCLEPEKRRGQRRVSRKKYPDLQSTIGIEEETKPKKTEGEKDGKKNPQKWDRSLGGYKTETLTKRTNKRTLTEASYKITIGTETPKLSNPCSKVFASRQWQRVSKTKKNGGGKHRTRGGGPGRAGTGYPRLGSGGKPREKQSG